MRNHTSHKFEIGDSVLVRAPRPADDDYPTPKGSGVIVQIQKTMSWPYYIYSVLVAPAGDSSAPKIYQCIGNELTPVSHGADDKADGQ